MLRFCSGRVQGKTEKRKGRIGMSSTQDGQVERLSTAECWALLQEAQLGRLAVVNVDGTPDIFPVNYIPHEGSLFIRTARDAKLAHIAHQPVIGYAEPETGGEGYIPLSPSKRPRSTQVLSRIADMFGYSLVKMAEGGIRGGGPVSSPVSTTGGGFHFTVAGNVYGVNDLEAYFREFQRKIENSQRAGRRFG